MTQPLDDDQEHAGDPAPAYDREAEVRRVLASDESLMGRIYCYERDKLTPQQIADAEGNQTPAFVYNYRLQINSIVHGEVPDSAWVARGVAAKLRRWLRVVELSPDLRRDLQKLESTARSRADDPDAEADLLKEAVTKTVEAEQKAGAGIYVYTLPHYLKHPIDPASGKTLLKVGHSARDAHYRAGSQGRLTALPEDPLLLRIYPAQESSKTEREFHAWLRDADHVAGRTRRAGSEWFVTSVKFLDRIAGSLNLEVIEVNQFDTSDDA
ncbi:hypothetical protein ENKNEFLB_03902 [Nocardioides aquaticus]|uniref:GIY-YIG nuclease family protein n=1 Tax=Nocardioides aquaticus TaxID=160826 RepID=A0ABX8ELU7_9ACTN|nr:hypothetical protein [Nocardioides aquaticus]QVT81492.1 hypothetical protein ENKNEFLB_03902 [Nocardioides aquaticus]